MRAFLAAGLALFLVLTAAPPHVHSSGGGDECATCVLRHTAPPQSATPDVAPIVHAAGETSYAPGLPRVAGFPLGAIPGQSPPAGP
jgi:hypothetical protein